MSDTLSNLVERMSEGDPAPGLKIVKAAVMRVTVAELREVIEKNPDHPCCQSFAKGIRGFPDNSVLMVEKLDLQAALENKLVILRETVRDGLRFVEKVLKGPEEAPCQEPTDTEPPADEPDMESDL